MLLAGHNDHDQKITMAIIQNTATPERASQIVNAVCVDVEDLGMRDTAYGHKHQWKVMFEGEEENEYGEPIWISRIYNASTHPDSAIRQDVESWNGTEMTDEEMAQFKFKDFLGEQFQLEVTPVGKNGKTYPNITCLKPATVEVVPSGLFKRREK